MLGGQWFPGAFSPWLTRGAWIREGSLAEWAPQGPECLCWLTALHVLLNKQALAAFGQVHYTECWSKVCPLSPHHLPPPSTGRDARCLGGTVRWAGQAGLLCGEVCQTIPLHLRRAVFNSSGVLIGSHIVENVSALMLAFYFFFYLMANDRSVLCFDLKVDRLSVKISAL